MRWTREDSMTPSAKLVAQREGGMVRRCHSAPYVIGTQDNAQHTFNMLILAYGLHPNPSPELIKAITFHDLHERYAGDLPATAKRMNPRLRTEYEAVCKSIDLKIGTTVAIVRPDEQRWLKALDGLESLEGLVEFATGIGIDGHAATYGAPDVLRPTDPQGLKSLAVGADPANHAVRPVPDMPQPG